MRVWKTVCRLLDQTAAEQRAYRGRGRRAANAGRNESRETGANQAMTSVLPSHPVCTKLAKLGGLHRLKADITPSLRREPVNAWDSVVAFFIFEAVKRFFLAVKSVKVIFV